MVVVGAGVGGMGVEVEEVAGAGEEDVGVGLGEGANSEQGGPEVTSNSYTQLSLRANKHDGLWLKKESRTCRR